MNNDRGIPISIPMIGQRPNGPQIAHGHSAKNLAHPAVIAAGNSALVLDGLTKLEWAAIHLGHDATLTPAECVARAKSILEEVAKV